MTQLALVAAAFLVTQQPHHPAAEAKTLTVMTFNLRYASDMPPNAWAARRPVAAALLRQHAPDVIATQEGLYGQLKDLEADLPAYAWIGLGREGGSRGEFTAVFYRRGRLEPLEFDHFWLSETPERIGSATWGNHLPRMVTWVKLRERESGSEFYFLNTHLDHESQRSREKSAALIAQRVAAWQTGLPVILAGDFNAAAGGNRAYDILVSAGPFRDTWLEAAEKGPDIGTFHDYAGPVRGGSRIDWILATPGVATHAAQIATYAENGQYPSDHFPVIARLALPEK